MFLMDACLTLLDFIRFLRLKRWARRTVPYSALPPLFFAASLPRLLLLFVFLTAPLLSDEALDDADAPELVEAAVEADAVESTLSSEDPASSPPAASNWSSPSLSDSGFFLRPNMRKPCSAYEGISLCIEPCLGNRRYPFYPAAGKRL